MFSDSRTHHAPIQPHDSSRGGRAIPPLPGGKGRGEGERQTIMWSGWLQEIIGYQHFFLWVILATIPSFLVVLLIPLDKEFGKKA